ncbi:MAG: UDP-N-acetylmuramoyl-L-alanine--D-glutamate ligase [Nitrospirae bacterium]|nr:UDP-N-acetylmuramoyl-L-alanine--D-glutamate ligase [Nitrospirota bacterium]MBI4838900.1 UDP-N-acetylmuramoyl-L-alanine--D-glutamate ligase [Nitrospirota bacterium]
MQEKERTRTFRDKNVLVVGLARSGAGAVNILVLLGARVWITDIKPYDSLKETIKLLPSSVEIAAGGHPEELFNKADIIVVSPGVSLDIPPLMRARIKGVPLIGELELAYRVIQEIGQGSEIRELSTLNSQLLTPSFVAVTGTNGKSTVTTLVDLMLKRAGFKTLLGGNIGNALTKEILKTVNSEQLTVDSEGKGLLHFPPNAMPDFIVAEVSSFQLESIEEFRPKAAAILNITPDHMDRYHTAEEYIDAKARIFENQGAGDFLVLNADDPAVMKVKSEKLKVKSEKPHVIYFSRQKEVEGAYLKDGLIYFNLPEFNLHPLSLNLQPSSFRIKGVHNLENAMAASLVALVSGCPADAVRDVLMDFPGLEHRLEFVCEIDGVSFINDSKGTNIGAVIKSLESFENIILIMGGRDKAGDFTVLRDLIAKRVQTLVLIGEAKEKIAKAAEGAADMVLAADINDAVEKSMSKACRGDVVLLSPGCASFDMFLNFEDRGRKFKEAVKQIKNLKLTIKN